MMLTPATLPFSSIIASINASFRLRSGISAPFFSATGTYDTLLGNSYTPQNAALSFIPYPASTLILPPLVEVNDWLYVNALPVVSLLICTNSIYPQFISSPK